MDPDIRNKPQDDWPSASVIYPNGVYANNKIPMLSTYRDRIAVERSISVSTELFVTFQTLEVGNGFQTSRTETLGASFKTVGENRGSELQSRRPYLSSREFSQRSTLSLVAK